MNKREGDTKKEDTQSVGRNGKTKIKIKTEHKTGNETKKI